MNHIKDENTKDLLKYSKEEVYPKFIRSLSYVISSVFVDTNDAASKSNAEMKRKEKLDDTEMIGIENGCR